ncbi:MAG: hypothetical protein FGM33_04885 [Candidatus Kapabacteria bacterium]|nr:hypothetical protein [Candidatus Kapabacteria bacterium]
MRHLLLALTLVFTAGVLRAQQPNVRQYIQQVAAGWTSDAKKALPDLLIDSPDDPGVLFLHASLIEDTKKASPLLERIIDAFPKSEWADDALARMTIMAATKNDVERARKTFGTMRDQYSQSELLPMVYEVMRATVGAPAPSDRAASAPAAKPAAAAAPKVATTYTMSVMTTTNRTDANKFAAKLKRKGLKAAVIQLPGTAVTRFSVRVGEYDTEAEALKELVLVRSACDCKPVVVKK